eukprot:702910-Pyramimonas_sp.AAC.1
MEGSGGVWRGLEGYGRWTGRELIWREGAGRGQVATAWVAWSQEEESAESNSLGSVVTGEGERRVCLTWVDPLAGLRVEGAALCQDVSPGMWPPPNIRSALRLADGSP